MVKKGPKLPPNAINTNPCLKILLMHTALWSDILGNKTKMQDKGKCQCNTTILTKSFKKIKIK